MWERVKCKNEGIGNDLETLKNVASNEFVVSSKSHLSLLQLFIPLFIYSVRIYRNSILSFVFWKKMLHVYN